MELAAIQAVDPKPIQKVAFIGSGPLPLTSLCLLEALRTNSPYHNQKLEVLNIDRSTLALTLSGNLCDKLGKRSEGMRFLLHEAGANNTQPSKFLGLL